MADSGIRSGCSPDRLRSIAPSDAETAHRAVERYRRMTFEERWEQFEAVQRDMDVLLDGRDPSRADPGHPFWKHWKDPSLGRPH